MTHARFTEAADRLDHTIEEIKARQYDATGTKPPPAPKPTRRPLNPDEDWAKSYATHAIRPPRRGESAPPAPGFKPRFNIVSRSKRPRFPDGPGPKAAAPAPEISAPGHIGGVLGKPAKKRGVLARLFHPRKG
jgi:hypothetical protein